MESTDSCSMAMAMAVAGGRPEVVLPPGFRFHPTDEELLIHYLRKRAASVPLPVPIIADIDLYKFDPWELPGMASFGEHEWYFFSQRDRKYPNGARPNRAATSGYWKATGTDKPVMTSSSGGGGGGREKLGVKKALVFYGGKPPKGIKTNWIMHEYRLIATASASASATASAAAATDHHHHTRNSRPNSSSSSNSSSNYNSNNKKAAAASLGLGLSLRLDDWVLCRIYHKNNSPCRLLSDDHDNNDNNNNNVRDHHDPSPGLGLTAPSSTSSTGGDDVVHNYLFGGGGGRGGGGELITRLQQFPTTTSSINNLSGLGLGLNTSELAVPPMKRTFPFLYWPSNGTAGASPVIIKRFHQEYYNNNNNKSTGDDQEDETSTSMAMTLLNQYHHHQQLQQQQINNHQSPSSSSSLISHGHLLGDGGLRHPAFQLPGVNWPYT